MGISRMITGPSIHFENVGLKLGGNTILDSVNLSVKPGSIHCIIGPNGGGKTSLLRCLFGQRPHTGEILIRWGRDTTIGYVPQSLEFDETLPLTVGDFLAMITQSRRPAFLGMKRDFHSEVERALDRVDMLTKIARPFGSLSGGERQRVLLAQALLPKPQMLVLDEPATGLDKSGAAIMHEIIEDLSSSGSTVLMIHHDLGVVKKMAHKVTCLNQKTIFSGVPSDELTSERIFSIFSTHTRAA